MKTLMLASVLLSSVSAFAANYECHDLVGKGKYSETVTAYLTINDQSDATFCSLDSVAKNFSGSSRHDSSSRTGSWIHWNKTTGAIAEEFYIENTAGQCARAQYTAETGDHVIADSRSVQCCVTKMTVSCN